VASNPAVIEAAGAVLWRPSKKHGVKVAVIHRPRYDDWSLPKGKAERGECPTVTASREVDEETGFAARIGRHIDTISYEASSSRKVVHYFSGQAVAGAFTPNREVDELEWLSVAKARARLSYPRDRAVLDSFITLPTALATVILVRHARAGQRDSFVGADSKRPLDRRGRKQAAELVRRLTVFGPAAVVAAPLERCRQTVAPLADSLRVAVTDEPSFSEAEYQHDPAAARRRTVELALAGADNGPTVVCSQGGVIPGVIKSLASRAELAIETTTTPKAAYWVLSFDDKRIRQADRYVLPDL
jgi:8-oxo-dGTP diphosphatase